MNNALRIAVFASSALLCGCRQDMHDQPRYEPLQPSKLFADGRASRPLVEGTVPRGGLKADREYYTGRHGVVRPAGTAPSAVTPPQAAGDRTQAPVQRPANNNPAADQQAPFSFDPDYVTEFPVPVTRQMLARGRERFNIFCTPCHGYTGTANGMIVQRGLSRPPSFHIQRLRQAPVGHFFDVMTNGFGAMYSYASRIPVGDRWAIIAYIRALQLSQGATIAEVPEDRRAALNQVRVPASSDAGGGTTPPQVGISPPPPGGNR